MSTQRFRTLRLFLSLFILISVFGATGPRSRSAASVAGGYVPGELLVKFTAGIAPAHHATGVDLGVASLNALAAHYGVTAAEPLFAGVSASSANLEQIYKLFLAPTADVMAAAETLSLDPNVVYAEPNYVLSTSETSNFPKANTDVPSAPQCDPQVYFGVKHCVETDGKTHVIIVDLKDPRIRVQTVLSSGPNGECNSVNHVGKDASSNCPNPYPWETIESMLSRYVSTGAVAIINTDYFGCTSDCGQPAGDHGAQRLAVRNGVRLDGPSHGVNNDLAYRQPSLAFSPSNVAVIGTPGSQAVIDANLLGTYYHTVGGAPIIVQNGSAVNTDCPGTYPVAAICASPTQSAAGLTKDNQLVLVTAQKNAADTANYLITTHLVQSAIKFDGGGSASLAWLDNAGQIQRFSADDPANSQPRLRPVAEGLLIFSQKIPIASPINASDPLFPTQYGLHNTGQTGGTPDADIDAPEAWGIGTGSTGTMVAVIDTGVYYTHDDLNDGRVRTDIDWDYVNNDNDALDDNGHGTHVAGIIAAETNNGFGTAGVMWQARILPLKVCNSRGQCNADHIARAIRYAADQGARVINMSLGGSCSSTIADAVNYAHFDKGVIVVAAAGSNGSGVNFPAKHDPTIAVGATDKADKITSFSSRGDGLDIMAPGLSIMSTVPKNGHDTLSGTSMASPFVAGVAGLLLAQRPNLTNEQVRDILRGSADDLGTTGRDSLYGFGRVNAFRALQMPAPSNPTPSARAEQCPVCAAVTAARDSTDNLSLLSNLRTLRDQVFTQDPGQRWARIYYEHQFEVGWLVLSSAQLRSDVLSGWREFDPAFRALIDPNAPSVTLTPELIATARRVMVEDVAGNASAAVQDVIVTEWDRVNPDRFIGWDVRDVWEQLRKENGPKVSLPIVRH